MTDSKAVRELRAALKAEEDCEKPPFEFGQTVYLADSCAYSEEMIPCPVCFGKRYITLILGNDEQVPVECENCGLGFEGPRGVVRDYQPTSTVKTMEVTGLSKESDGWRVHCGHTYYRPSDGNLFADRRAAEDRRKLLQIEAEKQARKNFESQFKSTRKHAGWSVGYHRKCIKDLERQLEWHRARLSKPEADDGD